MELNMHEQHYWKTVSANTKTDKTCQKESKLTKINKI